MRISVFTPARATTDEWARFHTFRRTLAAETGDDATPPPDERVEAELSQIDERRIEQQYVAELDDGRIVAHFSVSARTPRSPEYETAGHLVRARGQVLPSFRRQGIASSFLPHALDFLDARGARVLEASSSVDEGKAFLRARGFAFGSDQVGSKLDLGGVDWDVVRRWREDGEKSSPGTVAEVLAPRIPENRLDELCTALTLMINDVPFDDLDHGRYVYDAARKQAWYERLDVSRTGHATAILREPDEAISALTEVTYDLDAPVHIGQRFTGVRREHRGRGKARWVKAVMLEFVRDQVPTAVSIGTENSSTNAPMLAINRQLGFRPGAVRTYFQVGRDELAKVVSLVNASERA